MSIVHIIHEVVHRLDAIRGASMSFIDIVVLVMFGLRRLEL
jgi:hypothetical protein